jgi:spermidine/putrescine transport system ATP-binding protein
LVRLTGFERRRVQQLSGGEQQRVALARAIVLEPSVLLLDEPLGALDAQLRHDLQVELSGLQRALDTTFIYVTHDQEEAFTMSDRIGVMRNGRLLQVGSPEELYEEPASVAVATFVGTANIVPATVRDGTLEMLGMRMPTTASATAAVHVMVRPERVHVAADASRIIDGAASTRATVERVVFAGSSLQVSLRVAGAALVAEVPNDDLVPDLQSGQEVTVCVRAPDVRVLAE